MRSANPHRFGNALENVVRLEDLHCRRVALRSLFGAVFVDAGAVVVDLLFGFRLSVPFLVGKVHRKLVQRASYAEFVFERIRVEISRILYKGTTSFRARNVYLRPEDGLAGGYRQITFRVGAFGRELKNKTFEFILDHRSRPVRRRGRPR
jgi:hypothetical protein